MIRISKSPSHITRFKSVQDNPPYLEAIGLEQRFANPHELAELLGTVSRREMELQRPIAEQSHLTTRFALLF